MQSHDLMQMQPSIINQHSLFVIAWGFISISAIFVHNMKNMYNKYDTKSQHTATTIIAKKYCAKYLYVYCIFRCNSLFLNCF